MRYQQLLVAGLIAFSTLSPTACAEGGPAPSVAPAAQPSPGIAPPPGKTWSLEFDADFDGNTLDATKFTPCFDWNVGHCTSSINNGKEHYLPSQVQLDNGVARLVAEPLNPPFVDSACYEGTCTYKSGLISTARPDQSSPYLYTFTYGYVESRLKLPATPGMSTGLWMLPADPSYKYRSEIDIIENLGGKPDVIYQTYHYNNVASNYKVNDLSKDNNGACPKVDYSADFHTYGVDWQPHRVTFYIDGTECGRFVTTDPGQIEDGPMQIILNLGVDVGWSREANLILPSQTATDYVAVDYLRVWQAK